MNIKNNLQKIYNTLFVVILLGGCFWVLSRSNIYNLESSLYQKDFLIHNFSRLKIKLGDRVFNDVLIVKNGWLEYIDTRGCNLDDFQNLTDTTIDDVQLLAEKLVSLNQTLREQNITLLVLVAPNKATIYPENVPDEIKRNPPPSRLDLFSAEMQAHPDILYLDLRADLNEAKQQQRLYYKTDTHWNPYGAYLAYASIINKLSTIYPEIEPYPPKSFDFIEQTPTPKDLAKSMGAPFWVESGFKVKFRSSASPSNRILMLYGDSFSNALEPFLETHFPRYSTTHWDNNIDLQQIQTLHPDIVLIEVVERYLLSLNPNLP